MSSDAPSKCSRPIEPRQAILLRGTQANAQKSGPVYHDLILEATMKVDDEVRIAVLLGWSCPLLQTHSRMSTIRGQHAMNRHGQSPMPASTRDAEAYLLESWQDHFLNSAYPAHIDNALTDISRQAVLYTLTLLHCIQRMTLGEIV